MTSMIRGFAVVLAIALSLQTSLVAGAVVASQSPEHDGDPKQGLEVSVLLRGLRGTTEGRGRAELRLALRIGELKE